MSGSDRDGLWNEVLKVFHGYLILDYYTSEIKFIQTFHDHVGKVHQAKVHQIRMVHRDDSEAHR